MLKVGWGAISVINTEVEGDTKLGGLINAWEVGISNVPFWGVCVCDEMRVCLSSK